MGLFSKKVVEETVDGVLGAYHAVVNKLTALGETKHAEVLEHQNTIEELNTKINAATRERDRAHSIAAKMKAAVEG